MMMMGCRSVHGQKKIDTFRTAECVIPQRGMLSSAERNVNIRRFRWETRAKWKNRQQSEVWNVGSKCSNCCNPIPFCRCMNFTSRPEYQSKVCFESWPLWNNQD